MPLFPSHPVQCLEIDGKGFYLHTGAIKAVLTRDVLPIKEQVSKNSDPENKRTAGTSSTRNGVYAFFHIVQSPE